MKLEKKNFNFKIIGITKNLVQKKKINLYTTFFWKNEFFFFKDFFFLNFLFLKCTNQSLILNSNMSFFLYLELVFFLKYSYFWAYNSSFVCNNILPIKNFYLKKNKIYICLNYLNKDAKIDLFKYNMFSFINKWKVVEYFYIPTSFSFKWKFLLNTNLLKELWDLYYLIYVNINKDFTLIKFKLNDIFSYKFDYSMVYFFNDLVANLFKNISVNNTLLDNNLDEFLKIDWSFWKHFFSCLSILPTKYDSFWAFLNISLLFTTSFLHQMNIPATGFDIWYLKFFNLLFLRQGDAKHFFEVENMLIWGFKNIFYSWGSPYQNVNYGDYWNNLFINKKYYILPTLHANYHVSVDRINLPLKRKYYNFPFFNNYLLINQPYNQYINLVRIIKNWLNFKRKK